MAQDIDSDGSSLSMTNIQSEVNITQNVKEIITKMMSMQKVPTINTSLVRTIQPRIKVRKIMDQPAAVASTVERRTLLMKDVISCGKNNQIQA